MLANLYFKKCIQPKDEKRLAAQPAPGGVKELVNIRYVEDGHKLHLLDVYRPEEAEGKLPTIVDIHGGAWVYADKELNK
ncbi:MAG: alpha/beta hydrolase, partial [Faecalibacterium sp.]|nr:alpha/beta hydrolase [Faecalibacterium sp.]